MTNPTHFEGKACGESHPLFPGNFSNRRFKIRLRLRLRGWVEPPAPHQPHTRRAGRAGATQFDCSCRGGSAFGEQSRALRGNWQMLSCARTAKVSLWKRSYVVVSDVCGTLLQPVERTRCFKIYSSVRSRQKEVSQEAQYSTVQGIPQRLATCTAQDNSKPGLQKQAVYSKL